MSNHIDEEEYILFTLHCIIIKKREISSKFQIDEMYNHIDFDIDVSIPSMRKKKTVCSLTSGEKRAYGSLKILLNCIMRH